MTRTPFRAVLLAGGVLLVACGAAASAQAERLALFDRIESGHWELRSHDGDMPPQGLCLPALRRLFQLRHPGLNCSSLILADEPDEATVQYTCRGQGYGRTTVRRETPSLIQIHTQGIADGRPFEFTAEGRRLGNCGR